MNDFKIEIYADKLQELLNELDKLKKEKEDAKSLNQYLFKELEALKSRRNFDETV